MKNNVLLLGIELWFLSRPARSLPDVIRAYSRVRTKEGMLCHVTAVCPSADHSTSLAVAPNPPMVHASASSATPEAMQNTL